MRKFDLIHLGFIIFLFLLVLVCIIFSIHKTRADDKIIIKSYAISMYGDIKYPEGFKHLDYVNPNAPKGGIIRLAVVGTYDSLNPFILKGNSATGIGLCYETLMISSEDEPFTEYGLLAETIEYPENRAWVIFNLRPEAKWHNGKPVTSKDIVFSFNILVKKGHPFYRHYYASVAKVKALSRTKVKFTFKDSMNRELPLIIGQLPIISKEYYTKHEFNKTSLESPLFSGPYKIVEVKPGKSITYERVKDYWGKDLAVNKGKYNFDTIRFDYYRDETIIVEAFKAGEFDFRYENTAKVWATAYQGNNFDNGKIIKREPINNNPSGMQAFVYNTRREIFQDKRVRKALAYLFDFEWTNKTLFYNSYTRTKSYFSNSELASSGTPSQKELELLNPYRNQLPKEVFTKEYVPPTTDIPGGLRTNMRMALRLLGEAGWHIQKSSGLLINENNELFEFELLLVSPGMERIAIPFQQNLKKIGINMKVRLVDPSQYINRLNSYDFDMVTTVWGQSLSPGNEQRNFWSSEAADIEGTRNLAGIKNPVVDILIEKVISASNREELVTACRALDRVLLWNFYCIPQWHFGKYRIAYWDIFGFPKIKPKYSLGFPDTWWMIK